MGLYDFQPVRNSEREGQTKFIENPLPVPPRRERVEMNYDHLIPPEKMCYDIENPTEDYYDI